MFTSVYTSVAIVVFFLILNDLIVWRLVLYRVSRVYSTNATTYVLFNVFHTLKKKKFLINSIMLRFDNNVLNSFFFFLLLSFTPSRTQFFENFCAQCTLIFFNISKFVSIRITLYYCIKMTSTNKDKSHSIIMVTQLICKQTV